MASSKKTTKTAAKKKSAPKAPPKPKAKAKVKAKAKPKAAPRERSLADIVESAAPYIVAHLAKAERPLEELAALVLVDAAGDLNVRIDSAARLAELVGAQMPSSREIHESLGRSLEDALHCLVVVERSDESADVTYVELELETRAR